MSITISIAAFVIGLLLVVAALIGQEITVKELKLPALGGRGKRFLVGLFGIVLMVFGANDGKLPLPTEAASPRPIAPQASAAASAGAVVSTSTSCFADVAAANVVPLPVMQGQTSMRRFGTGQPHADTFALEFVDDTGRLGSILLKTNGTGLGFTLIGVVDGTCRPVTTYENTTEPGAPKDSVGTFHVMRYSFGPAIISVDMFYRDDQIEAKARLIAP